MNAGHCEQFCHQDVQGLSVSGRQSTNTVVAPRRQNALAVEQKVNEGTITSSPGPRSSSIADMSSAWVHDVVSKAAGALTIFVSSVLARSVNGPSPASVLSR